jgi:hypothetical protein
MQQNVVNFFKDTCDCNFYVGGSAIENVCRYSHLGHIITSSFSNIDDVTYRRNCLVGQSNNILCFFKLDMLVRLNLFKSYCSSMYGCELRALNNNDNVDLFCVAWRKALRRVLNLPYNTHSRLLPILADTFPISDEICKRSAHFITSCISSPSRLVRSVSWHSVFFGKFSSPLGSNALLCCLRYGWSLDSFVLNLVQLPNSFFHLWYRGSLPNIEIYTAMSLLELIFVREGQFTLPGFTKSQIISLITALYHCLIV